MDSFRLGLMTQLSVGDKAPDFTAESTAGTLALSELCRAAEVGVIVFFYPKAMTPGCTREACDFRDSIASLTSAGYTVVGVSADSIPVLQRFAEKESLNFPLICDENREILQSWGAWGQKKNYGKTYEGIIRSTVVVDKNACVTLAQYGIKATGHVARLRKALGLDAD